MDVTINDIGVNRTHWPTECNQNLSFRPAAQVAKNDMSKNKIPGRGKKQCPACDEFMGVRTRECQTCGHVFEKKKTGTHKAGDRAVSALAELAEHLREDKDLTSGSFMKAREIDLNELVKSGVSQAKIQEAVEQVKNQFDFSVLTAKEFETLCSILKKMM